MKKEYCLTIYWNENEYGVDVVKSKYGFYDSFKSAAEHGIEILSKPENKDMWVELMPVKNRS